MSEENKRERLLAELRESDSADEIAHLRRREIEEELVELGYPR